MPGMITSVIRSSGAGLREEGPAAHRAARERANTCPRLASASLARRHTRGSSSTRRVVALRMTASAARAGRSLRDPLCGGQVDLEGRPLLRLGIDLDAAAVLLYRAVDHREPEAGSLAATLGGEERLEQVRAHFVAHPRAVVRHGEHHVAPRDARRLARRLGSSTQRLEVAIVSRPPAGIASRALTARLTRICSTCPGSKRIGSRPRRRSPRSSMSSPIKRRIIFRSDE